MPRYPNGQPVTIGPPEDPLQVRDKNGNLIDAGTVTITLQLPDATTATYTPVHDSLGTYHTDIPASPDLAQNGHYLWKFVTTGAGAGVTIGDFDVYDPFIPAVLPLQDAKDALNIAETTTLFDNQIQAFLDTIEASLETLIGGPIVTRTITNERVRQTYYNPVLVLRQRIIQAVTSIVDEWTGAAMDTTSVVVDPVTNILSRKGNLPFLFRGPWCLVTYTACAGYRAGLDTPPVVSVPAAFNAAARLIIQHLWQTQRGPGMAPVPNMDETFLPGMSFAIPNRALELLDPYLQEVYL